MWPSRDGVPLGCLSDHRLVWLMNETHQQGLDWLRKSKGLSCMYLDIGAIAAGACFTRLASALEWN